VVTRLYKAMDNLPMEYRKDIAVVSGHVLRMGSSCSQPSMWCFVSDTDLAEPKVELCTVTVELLGHGLGLQHLDGGLSEVW
jgi:hypothetical protein